MFVRKILIWSGVAALLVVVGVAAALTQQYWSPYLFPRQHVSRTGEAHADHEVEQLRIRLSDQARKNIGLKLRPVELTSFTKSLRVPAVVVPDPARTQIKVSMPITSVVKAIHVSPGEVVRPGDKLFTLHLHYHELHKAQADLYKTAQELKINEEEQSRFRELAKAGAIPEAKMLNLQYENRRLKVALHALRENLRLHRFTSEQIERILTGDFIDEWTVRVPATNEKAKSLTPEEAGPMFEVGHLEVKVGDQVEAGKTLCELANHEHLLVEARVVPSELPAVRKALEEATQVKAVIHDRGTKEWHLARQPLELMYVDPHYDPASQSVGVFLRLANESVREYRRDGKTYRLWKYRPGQRVYVSIPVERLTGVFVLPEDAAVREGAEWYVFRENGPLLVAQPVHVLSHEAGSVVIADDGSLLPGSVVAQNGAAQLLRAIRLKSEDGGHHHHDH